MRRFGMVALVAGLAGCTLVAPNVATDDGKKPATAASAAPKGKASAAPTAASAGVVLRTGGKVLKPREKPAFGDMVYVQGFTAELQDEAGKEAGFLMLTVPPDAAAREAASADLPLNLVWDRQPVFPDFPSLVANVTIAAKLSGKDEAGRRLQGKTEGKLVRSYPAGGNFPFELELDLSFPSGYFTAKAPEAPQMAQPAQPAQPAPKATAAAAP